MGQPMTAYSRSVCTVLGLKAQGLGSSFRIPSSNESQKHKTLKLSRRKNNKNWLHTLLYSEQKGKFSKFILKMLQVPVKLNPRLLLRNSTLDFGWVFGP